MKQILFAFTLIITLSSAAIARPGSADKKLLHDLSLTLKNSHEVKWINTVNYDKAVFDFKGQKISAFYSSESKELLGFFIQTGSEGIADAIQKRFSNFTIVDAGQFIDASGGISYFALVKNKKTNLVLKITPRGSVSIYSRVFSS